MGLDSLYKNKQLPTLDRVYRYIYGKRERLYCYPFVQEIVQISKARIKLNASNKYVRCDKARLLFRNGTKIYKKLKR